MGIIFKNPFKSTTKTTFSSPPNQSAGILDDHAVRKVLLTREIEGQTTKSTTSLTTPIIYGSENSGENLQLHSTSHATKGNILLGTSAYNETNDTINIGNTSPTYNGNCFNAQKTVDDALGMSINNLSAGTNASTFQVFYNNLGNYGIIGITGSNYSAIPIFTGNVGIFASATDMILATAGTSKDFVFHSGPALPEVARITSGGILRAATVQGSTASGGDLTIQSTSNATKGQVYFGNLNSTYYNEPTDDFYFGANAYLSAGQQITCNYFETPDLVTAANYTIYINSQNTGVNVTGYPAASVADGQYTQSAGTFVGLRVNPRYNQSGTAGATDLLIKRTETAVGSGSQLLIDAQVGSDSRFQVTNTSQTLVKTSSNSSAPSIAFIGDTDTGIYQITSNQFSMSAGGSRSVTFKGNELMELSSWRASATNKEFDITGAIAAGSGSSRTSLKIANENTLQAADRLLCLYGDNRTTERWLVKGLGAITQTSTLSLATGNEVAYTLNYTTNKATSGNDTGLLIGMTDTASPGTSLLLDLQVGATSKFSVDNTGKADAQTYSVAGSAGASGTFTTVDGKTVTVTSGIITSIV